MPYGPLSKVVSGAKVTTASSSLLPSSPLGTVIATWPRQRHSAPSPPLGPGVAPWPRHRRYRRCHLAPVTRSRKQRASTPSREKNFCAVHTAIASGDHRSEERRVGK